MKLFQSHLRETGENYFEHFLFAFTTSMWLFLASIILLSHAIFPNIFTTTTSSHVKKINEVMQKRLAILNERRKNQEMGKNS
jgi:hypothetical protein